jgi:hypothetical protein
VQDEETSARLGGCVKGGKGYDSNCFLSTVDTCRCEIVSGRWF